MKDFVTFEIAKKLKEEGFNEGFNIFGYKLIFSDKNTIRYIRDIGAYEKEHFGINIPCPSISQTLEWLRKEKKIFIAINLSYCYESHEKPFPTNPKMEPILKGYYYGIWDLGNLNDENGHSEYFESPEQAALAGIEYALDNLI